MPGDRGALEEQIDLVRRLVAMERDPLVDAAHHGRAVVALRQRRHQRWRALGVLRLARRRSLAAARARERGRRDEPEHHGCGGPRNGNIVLLTSACATTPGPVVGKPDFAWK